MQSRYVLMQRFVLMIRNIRIRVSTLVREETAIDRRVYTHPGWASSIFTQPF